MYIVLAGYDFFCCHERRKCRFRLSNRHKSALFSSADGSGRHHKDEKVLTKGSAEMFAWHGAMDESPSVRCPWPLAKSP